MYWVLNLLTMVYMGLIRETYMLRIQVRVPFGFGESRYARLYMSQMPLDTMPVNAVSYVYRWKPRWKG